MTLLFSARKIECIFAIFGGFLLMILGFRQTICSFIMLPSAPTVTSIHLRERASPDSIDGLIANEETALAIRENPANWSDLGLALALKLSSMEIGNDVQTEQEDMLRKSAVQALTRSLQLAPANPYVWARLAALTEQANNDQALALAYWRMAQLTGPNEKTLRLARLEIGLPLWNIMSDTDRSEMLTDCLQAWPDDAGAILSLAKAPFARSIIRSSLIIDLNKLRHFEREFHNQNPNEK